MNKSKIARRLLKIAEMLLLGAADNAATCICKSDACAYRMKRGLMPFCTMPTPVRVKDPQVFDSYSAAVAASPVGKARWLSGGGTTGSPRKFLSLLKAAEMLLTGTQYPVNTNDKSDRIHDTDSGTISTGVYPQKDGTFLAMTLTQSKTFRTRKGAEAWLARRG